MKVEKMDDYTTITILEAEDWSAVPSKDLVVARRPAGIFTTSDRGDGPYAGEIRRSNEDVVRNSPDRFVPLNPAKLEPGEALFAKDTIGVDGEILYAGQWLTRDSRHAILNPHRVEAVESAGWFRSTIEFEFAGRVVREGEWMREGDTILEANRDCFAAPGTAVAKPPVSLVDEIRKLAHLRAQGVLTDDEFAAAKERLING